MTEEKKDKIIDDMIKYLGLGQLAPEKQEEILSRLGEVMLKKIFIGTMEKLGEDEQREFEKMLEDGANADSVEKFLSAKIENYDTMIVKIANDLKEELKNS